MRAIDHLRQAVTSLTSASIAFANEDAAGFADEAECILESIKDLIRMAEEVSDA